MRGQGAGWGQIFHGEVRSWDFLPDVQEASLRRVERGFSLSLRGLGQEG